MQARQGNIKIALRKGNQECLGFRKSLVCVLVSKNKKLKIKKNKKKQKKKLCKSKFDFFKML